MNNLKMATTAILTAALLLVSMPPVFATAPPPVTNADRAATLRDLGLYMGQDASDPRVGLESALTTQDSLIFLARLFGYDETSSRLTEEETAAALARFDDAASISDYARNIVAYSTANGILQGVRNGDSLFLGARDTVTAARFATFMLRQMGYTVANYLESPHTLAETQGYQFQSAVSGELTRDVAVGMMYGALTAEKADGRTVLIDIAGDDADFMERAARLGLLMPDQGQATPSENDRPRRTDYPGIDGQSFVIAEKGMLYIVYSKAMNEAQMLDPANYQISIDQGISYMPLGADDTITRLDERSVQIYVRELEDMNKTAIRLYAKVEPIRDAEGRKLYNLNGTYTAVILDLQEAQIEVAQLVAKDRIKVLFNRIMESIPLHDIALANLTTWDSIRVADCESTIVNSDDVTETVLILDHELATDGTDEDGARIKITGVLAPYPPFAWGDELREEYSISIDDETAPETVLWDHDDDDATEEIAKAIGSLTFGTITLYFSEDIDETTLTPATFSGPDYTVTSLEALAGTKRVILNIQADPGLSPDDITVMQDSDLYDLAGNVLEAGTTWAVTQREPMGT